MPLPTRRDHEATDDEQATQAEVRALFQRPLVIERPELQNGVQRWSYRGLTVMFWVLWLYLFMPLLSVLAWAAGMMVVYEVMVQNLALSELWHLLKVYGTGIGFLLVVYLGYAFSGFLRFRNVERRKLAPAIAPEQLAQSHNLDMATLKSLQTQQTQVLSPELLERMFPKQR